MPKIVRAIALILLCPLCLTVFVSNIYAKQGISGECACLYLPQKDEIIYDKNADKRHPMASTTKIMTTLVVLEHCNLNEPVTVSEDAAGTEGSSLYLKGGEVITVENLLYALMLASANDVATALAIHTAGSVEAFADLMNEKAYSLNLKHTHFTNPHGLADDAHYTTAADLARIAGAAMENETFSQIVSTKSKVIASTNGETVRTLRNHNKLLSLYENCIGIKTGFTKDSGRCLVSAAERNGMLLIAVTLDAPNDWHDHTSLLNYGFSTYEGHILCEAGDFQQTIPVINGQSKEVSVSVRNTVCLPTKRNTAPIECTVEINRFAVAPIKAGQVLGILRFTQDGLTILTVPLLSEQSVKQQTKNTIFGKIKDLLNL